MKKVIMLVFFLIIGLFHEVNAQAESTKIVKFEIDGKEIKRNYKIFFRLTDKWVEARKTPTGFIIPVELRKNEHLAVLITLGKYKLEFSQIHVSKFDEDWIVGIDKKPFSEENVAPEEIKSLNRVYYIHFVGSALETRLVIKEKIRNR